MKLKSLIGINNINSTKALPNESAGMDPRDNVDNAKPVNWLVTRNVPFFVPSNVYFATYSGVSARLRS